MLELKGAYNDAKVFTDQVEEGAISQIMTLCNMEFVEGSKIRIMPDVHAGAGCTIGTTMTIQDKAVPNLVGVDIGCGMETVQLDGRQMELQRLDQLIHEKIPSGFDIRKGPHPYSRDIDLGLLRCKAHVNLQRGFCSIGTLGGGNHFIEVNRDEEDNFYIVVHSGSRHLGKEVAEYYQKAGYEALSKENKAGNIPYALAYVEGTLFDDYLHDMKLVQEFADLNRKGIMNEIVRGMKFDVADRFTTVHNYIDTDQMILRKGAVSAQRGEMLLIPINMRDGSLICIGKGNEDWNYSAPHGAGRLMSRSRAKENFSLSQFQKEMKDIYTTSVGRDTLDECPMAYKDVKNIVDNIGPSAEILKTIKPVYNFKAGGVKKRRKKK